MSARVAARTSVRPSRGHAMLTAAERPVSQPVRSSSGERRSILAKRSHAWAPRCDVLTDEAAITADLGSSTRVLRAERDQAERMRDGNFESIAAELRRGIHSLYSRHERARRLVPSTGAQRRGFPACRQRSTILARVGKRDVCVKLRGAHLRSDACRFLSNLRSEYQMLVFSSRSSPLPRLWLRSSRLSPPPPGTAPTSSPRPPVRRELRPIARRCRWACRRAPPRPHRPARRMRARHAR